MKYFFAVIFLLSVNKGLQAQSKAVIGMTIAKVKKIYPDIKNELYDKTTTLSRPEILYGLDGSWGYRIEKEKLDWIYFSKYIDEINEPNFKKCLKAAKQLIKDYTKKYGVHDSSITGNTKFIDPYKTRHWGYHVIEARWKNYQGMKLNVEFTFMGGKGSYHFLVKLNYFGKDYLYFD